MDASETASTAPRASLAEPGSVRQLATAVPELLTSFVGREREVAAVCDLVARSGVRLLTLTGPGGVGKTRLALAVTAGVRAAFTDGVTFVPVVPVATPVPLSIALASALGLDQSRPRSLEDAIDHYLVDRNLLLVLDNAEPVVADGPWLAQLIAAHLGLVILATSRRPLGIYGEHLVPVLPLELPPDPLPSLADLTGYSAIRLFVARAEETAPNFTLSEANALAVAAICRRLDGLPLAIELAAARVRYLAPAPLLSLLEPRLPLLSGGSPTQPARLRSLRDAIAWSYDLLPEAERVLFRRLAVFAGGFTVAAAVVVTETVEGGTAGGAVDSRARANVLMRLAMLADHSLLAPGAPDEPQARFSMLETVREFASEQLSESGEGPPLIAAHAAFYLELAERAATGLVGAE